VLNKLTIKQLVSKIDDGIMKLNICIRLAEKQKDDKLVQIFEKDIKNFNELKALMKNREFSKAEKKWTKLDNDNKLILRDLILFFDDYFNIQDELQEIKNFADDALNAMRSLETPKSIKDIKSSIAEYEKWYALVW